MKRLLAACAIALAPVLTQAATLPSSVYSNTVVFGDSLSDAGTFGVQATDTGRNFATLGARAIPNATESDFAEQLAIFDEAAPHLPDYSQAVVWFGGNDLRALTSPLDIGLAVGNITAGVMSLSTNYGIDRFVLPGLPDLSQIPERYLDPSAFFASQAFNEGLIGAVRLLNGMGIDTRYVDIGAVFDDVIADPALINPPETCERGLLPCENYAFWDGIHPTGVAHARVAEAIAAELAPVPLPAGAPLILTGLLALGALRWRRGAAA